MSGWQVEQIGACTLYCGDAYGLISQLEADALITDPPYGQGYVSDTQSRPPVNNTGRKLAHPYYGSKPIYGHDTHFDPQPWLARFPHAILWGANYYADKLPPLPSWIVWDKRGGSGAYDGLLTFADGELAWCSDGKPLRFHRQIWNGLIRQGRDAGTPRLHPMQKPVELLQVCIQRFPAARVILDPFAGSFTTALAALTLGKACIAIEIEEAYWELGCRRVEAAYAQGDLFVPQPPPPRPLQPSFFAEGGPRHA